MSEGGEKTTTAEALTRPSKKTKVDLYKTLGIEKTATPHDVQKAYRKLALRYHPDRNQGCGEAAETFKEISTAYAILSDPNLRRQYDVTGDSPDLNMGGESYDLETAGITTRIIGAMFSRFGFSIHTQVGPSTLLAAQDIYRASRMQEDPRVTPLVVGRPAVAQSDRQQGLFFCFSLTEEEAARGVIITCVSTNKSRMKLIVFGTTGSVRCVQESAYTLDKKLTTANIFAVGLETSSLLDPVPKVGNEETPPVFNRLSTLLRERRQLEAGDHLLCVYGDNWMSKTHFTLTLLAADQDAHSVNAVKGVDDALFTKREELEHLQVRHHEHERYMAPAELLLTHHSYILERFMKEEYEELKAKWEKLQSVVETSAQETEALLVEREKAYNAYIAKSTPQQCGSTAPTASHRSGGSKGAFSAQFWVR